MASQAAAPAPKVEGQEKPRGILDLIERIGNKVPHPAILFLALCAGVIILSQILFNPPADSYRVVDETIRVEGLLTVTGVRYLFTSFVSNFMGFTAMGSSWSS